MLRFAVDDDLVAVVVERFRELLHAGDERARCVDDVEAFGLGGLQHVRRDAVRADDDGAAVDLVDGFLGPHAHVLQRFDDGVVVDDGAEGVDGVGSRIRGIWSRLDSAFDAETESEFFSD